MQALLIVCVGSNQIPASAGFVAEAERSWITILDIQGMVH